MGGKKVPLKPPLKAAAQAAVPVPSERAPREPNSVSHPSLRGAASAAPSERAHPPAPQREVEVDVVVTGASGTPSYEVQVSPSLIKRMGWLPGVSYVEISTASDTIVCEVGLSLVLARNVVGVSSTTAAVLVEEDAVMRTLPLLSSVKNVLLSSLAPDDALGKAKKEALQGVSGVQLIAGFRQQCQGHAIFQGMVLTLRIAAHQVRVEVSTVVASPTERGTCAGVLTPASSVAVSLQEGAASTVASRMHESSSPNPDAPQQQQHMLFVGDAGCGKTFQLQEELRRCRSNGSVHCIEINVSEFLQKNAQGGVTNATALRDVFNEACAFAPSVIAIDDLQLLCPSAPSPAVATIWGAAHTSAAVASELDRLAASTSHVRILATAPREEDIAPSLLAHHRLGAAVVAVATPATPEARLEVLRRVFEAYAESSPDIAAKVLPSIADNAHGCTQRDLARLKKVSVNACFARTGTSKVEACDVQEAAKQLRPSALSSMDVTIPNVSWADIGGSGTAKQALQECVEWCLGKNKWIFETFKLSPPKGVLLYGPPGCSKTMLAKALANESKMNFISVKGPEVFSKWVGDSEKAVRDVFRKARAVAPCVVFVDELDGMCGHRGSGGVSDRVISQFLTELDGLPAAMSDKSDSIILVAATNRPENIDGAVLRPGRIDKKVYVGLPDEGERVAIASIHVKKMPCDANVTADFIASRTAGYTGAEVVAVCKESAFHALERNFSADVVTLDDVHAALVKVIPRIGNKEVEWYQQWARGRH